MPLVRFGFGTRMYTFPGTLQGYSDNFTDVVPRTVRLPGLSGGFDQYGDDEAPAEIGKVQQQWMLVATDREDMDALRDDVRAMKSWGKAVLWMQPTDPDEPERFCWARLNNLNLARREHDHTDLWQPVAAIWQVDSPYWLVPGSTEAALWGDGVTTWGGGRKWGGAAALQAASGLSTTLAAATNGGNARALPRITIYVGAGQTCVNPVVERLVGGAVADSVGYAGTLSAGSVLEINCRAASVLLNKADAYAALTYSTPDWMQLLPGANVLRLRMGTAGSACSVAVRWYDTYV